MDEQRQRVVEIARSWIGTPYHHAQHVKGAGVDCAWLIIEVFHEAGLAPHVDPGYYPRDWHFHRNDERYLGHLEEFSNVVLHDPLPGDIVTFRFGRSHSHGAIVSEWPLVIHAYYKHGAVTESNVSETPMLISRIGPLYRLKEWC